MNVLKFIILLQLIFFTGSVFSQESINGYCSYQTDGSGHSKGIKIKVAYPCNYEAKNASLDTNTIKKFSNKGKQVISLSIDKFPSQFTEDEIKENFNIDNFKAMLERDGDVLEIKNNTIDNIPVIEAIWIQKNIDAFDNTFYSKSLNYFFYYGKYFIKIIYCTYSKEESEVNKDFAALLRGFRVMAQSTEFLN